MSGVQTLLILKTIEEIINFMTLSRLGLIFNIMGTLVVAISFGKNLEEAHQVDAKNRKVYLASFLYPKLFKVGLILIVLGFFLQMID